MVHPESGPGPRPINITVEIRSTHFQKINTIYKYKYSQSVKKKKTLYFVIFRQCFVVLHGTAKNFEATECSFCFEWQLLGLYHLFEKLFVPSGLL